MTPTVFSLQERLFHADLCYRRRHSLDFLPGASADNPLLAISTKNLIALTYRILISRLRVEAQNLSLVTPSVEAKGRLLLLIDNLTSRLSMVENHVRSVLFLSHRNCPLRPCVILASTIVL
jgi:hypothetical protein